MSLNSLTDSTHGTGYSSALGVGKSTRNNLLLHPLGMEHLSKILPRLEEADFSGQCEIGIEGWGFFIKGLKQAVEQGMQINLKKLTLRYCKMKEETKSVLLEGINKYHSNLDIEFGEELDNMTVKGRASWFKGLMCSNGDNN